MLPASAEKKAPTAPSFAALVAKLRAEPGDAVLREKVVRAAAKVRPAIPEEARRHFVKASTLQKEARSAADYAPALAEYEKALALAPWWADAYHNQSVALESVERFTEAQAALKLYLASGPADARAAQDRLYALEAKADSAASRPDFAGNWGMRCGGCGGDFSASLQISAAASGGWKVRHGNALGGDPASITPDADATNVVVEERKLTFTASSPHAQLSSQGRFHYALTLSADGKTLAGTWRYEQYSGSPGFFAQAGTVPVAFTR